MEQTSTVSGLVFLTIVLMGVGRVLLGVTPFVAAGLASRLLGFPPTQDNPTTRLMGRFFGVRNIGLGVLVWYGLANPAVLGFCLLFNSLTDVFDLAAIAIPVVKRQGLDRAAFRSACLAVFAATGYLIMWLIVVD